MLSIATSVERPGYLHTLLVLGRISNLPTVWSNCVAGWLLGGGGEWRKLTVLCAGGTFLYIGGMYLNDAFDAQFDAQHRPERPIPSGAISESAVWKWGFSWLLIGCVLLGLLGKVTAVIAVMLAMTIVVYDAIHKIFAFSPVLMALCRFYLYLIAASAALGGITGGTQLAIWSGIAMACYIVGLSYIARRESTGVTIQYWPLIFLVAPIVLAVIVNPGEYLVRAIVFSGLVLIWILRCLVFAFRKSQRHVGRTVSGLLAGIVLVDLLMIAPAATTVVPVFLGLFVLALVLQRFVPAT
jgi:4-hydroxybenzoate polyprenyltransferase